MSVLQHPACIRQEQQKKTMTAKEKKIWTMKQHHHPA
jgi:hypothetical protein